MRSLCEDVKVTAQLLWKLAKGQGARTDYLLLGSAIAAGLAVGCLL
tara:strand:- start:422 stop:559 length:138 start_codon:yes stop_codon:yes gene_type:complete